MKLFSSSTILSSQILFIASCPIILLATFACLRVGVFSTFFGSIPKRESTLLLRVSAVVGVGVEVALVVGWDV